MQTLTLKMLDTGYELKTALDNAYAMFGLDGVKDFMNAWLDANDKGVSHVETLMSEADARDMVAQEVL